METLDTILDYCQANNRICPMPQKWNGLFKMLMNKKQKPTGGWEPSLPLILAAWADTPGLMKALRLREHLQWAKNQNQLEEVSLFLRSLNEEEWFHLGE